MQRDRSRACVWCGRPGNMFCARCGVAPYCSARCQHTDWTRRHSIVCHNLARPPSPAESPSNEPSPLRRPRSPSQRRDMRDDAAAGPSSAGQKKAPRNINLKNRNIRTPMKDKKTDEENNKPVDDEEEESYELKEPTPKAVPGLKPMETLPTMPSSVKPENAEAVPPDNTPDNPKNFAIQTLSVGAVAFLSVDSRPADCKSTVAGYVCLSLRESWRNDFQRLCSDYGTVCEADDVQYEPNLGELFSLLNPEDGGWYRARLLDTNSAALIDASKVISLTGSSECRKITPEYAAIPEFCCLLEANVEIGENLRITILSVNGDVYKVKLEKAECGTTRGAGNLRRWRPEVMRGKQAVKVNPVVRRPDLVNGSKVLIVEASTLDNVFVRLNDYREHLKYSKILRDVTEYGLSAVPVQEPPQMGQIVVAEKSIGQFFRALCKRTKVSQNKYQLEYIDLGIVEVTTKESIYPCPAKLNLDTVPTLLSQVKLKVATTSLTRTAFKYLQKLRENKTELVLKLPDGSKTAPSGSEVILTVYENFESINKKLKDLCSIEWKKIESFGENILDCPAMMYCDLEFLALPETGCKLHVLDASMLKFGTLSVCVKDLPYAKKVFTTLTTMMEDYCYSEIGQTPYLPKLEELCIAQCPPYRQWFRAALCDLTGGPGNTKAQVLYIDYGHLQAVPVSSLRKIPPNFVRGLPALATQIEIVGFPEDPTDRMINKALKHMNIDIHGRGELTVTKCSKRRANDEIYLVEAPDLLEALGV